MARPGPVCWSFRNFLWRASSAAIDTVRPWPEAATLRRHPKPLGARWPRSNDDDPRRRAHVPHGAGDRLHLRVHQRLLHPLIVAGRTVKKPRFTRYERGLFVILARLVPRSRDAPLVVKPGTILRWHRGRASGPVRGAALCPRRGVTASQERRGRERAHVVPGHCVPIQGVRTTFTPHPILE
jgi:hypothetical protein